ncbi:MAG: DegT/DnrJ/EryC1/StrS family aminotransferase [Pseudomonadota bacterium]|nr:DegT/DnrJ/EryC1/StrS family aminotransferase [Pseudomonadota bacterium]
MKIPYVDIGAQSRALKKELMSAVETVLEHGNFVLGQELETFEKQFAEYCGVDYAVGVNSGTDALFLSLKALGVGPGDEVITAPNSFIATASVIIAVGARPVFVDVREDYNIDPSLLPTAITAKTKAIIPVHLTGRPADMDAIMNIAARKGIYVIEDAAQAAGASYGQKRTGSLGHVGCFSLHPLKTLNACGDGGVITTNDREIYEKLRLLRNFGLVNRDETVMWGYNSRLDSLQAAMLLLKLKYLDAWNEKRRDNAEIYRSLLKNVAVMPWELSYEYCVYHTFVVQVEKRDDLQAFLERNGIGTRVHYPVPIHMQPAAQSLGCRKGDFPTCEAQADRILSLPVHQGLSEAQIHYVAQKIRVFYRGK